MKLANMTPRLARLDLLHGAAADSKSGCQLALRQRPTQDNPHIRLGQLRQAMLLTPGMRCGGNPPITLNRISNIVALGAHPQMKRLHANGPIAAVQHIEHSHRPDEYVMADPVRQHTLLCVEPNDPVTATRRIQRAAPIPARLFFGRQSSDKRRLLGHEPSKGFFGGLSARAVITQRRLSVAVAVHALVVHPAHAVSVGMFAAIPYRASGHVGSLA